MGRRNRSKLERDNSMSPMFYVHQCVKCGDRKESNSSSLPRGWVEATIDEYDKKEAKYMWCSTCWLSIKLFKVPVPGVFANQRNLPVAESIEPLTANLATPTVEGDDIPF